MAEIAFFGSEENSVDRVFSKGRKEKVCAFGRCLPETIGRHNIREWKEELVSVKYAFSTWGMPDFTEEEIKQYLPSLKYLFYAAGTVKNFAENMFACGVRIFSSRRSNAIPVAETVFAQILLANKGFFRASMQMPYGEKKKIFEKYEGNYGTTVGLIGVGTIGALVAKKLKDVSVRVIAWDKYLAEERAAALGISMVSLEEVFLRSDVVSNHLADKPETEGILNYPLFSKMKKYATFINSGRGRQVVEKDLLRALAEEEGRTAVLDVTYPEPPDDNGALMHAKNVIVTPHMDGSSGAEIIRMADEMIDTFCRIREGKETDNEVFLRDLPTMA